MTSPQCCTSEVERNNHKNEYNRQVQVLCMHTTILDIPQDMPTKKANKKQLIQLSFSVSKNI